MLIAKKIQYNICLLLVALPLVLSASWAQATAQKPLIITTIKPLAIIAKAAVGDQAQVEYLQSAVQSAHEVSLPVSALIRLGQADLVLWIGKGFEARISKPMALLPETKLITVMDLPMLPAKSSAEEAVSSDESEDDHHSHHHHDHLQFDPHIWLNPANGNILANSIQQRLKLPLSPIISAELVEQLKAELRPIKDRNYLTHHDAYAHFATAFDLTEGLSIRDASGASQGAKSQYKLRQQALSVKASCIFIEPQYADKDARILARELQLPLQILDQQGFDQPLTADAYSQFMAGLVSQFKACFE